MRETRGKIATVFLSLMVLLSSCGTETGGKEIVVGAKGFTENMILGELYALALEDAGYMVERKFDLSDSVIHDMLTEGDIDVYPEYTETALRSVLREDSNLNVDGIYETVKEKYKKWYHLEVLECSNVNYQKGLGVRTSFAKEHNIWTISQLREYADQVRFGGSTEFMEQEDGIGELEERYGSFSFQEISDIGSADKYTALKDEEVDCIVVYVSDSQLNHEEFTLLEDDQKVWLPDFAFPVMQSELAEREPEAVEAINRISSLIEQEEMILLNEEADHGKGGYEGVALAYYQNK